MFDFLRSYQLDIMLGLASICLVISLFTAVTKSFAMKRKIILLAMELCSSVWLFADRVAYMYHGVPGDAAYVAVRVSNFLVFLMTVSVLGCINKYFEDVLLNEVGLKDAPIQLKIADVLVIIAIMLVVISQFTHLYYTFDENNTYQRGQFYFVSYIFPYTILLIQAATLIIHFRKIKGKVMISLIMFDFVCIFVSAIQFFAYGVSLMDMAAVFMVIVVYTFALLDLNERIEKANNIIINHLKDEQENMKQLFDRTASLLAEAIDSKCHFNKGKTVRIAEYAREIAKRAGKDESACNDVYYASLLHDVGKVMLPDSLVQNKNNLSISEKETLRTHTQIGGELLSKLTEYPFLSTGAKSHHERFDGQGYPDGLTGPEIPDVARIIAIAEEYETMTSKSAIQEPLPQRTVREELIKGSGSRFDPDYIKAVIAMIDDDTEYLLKEQDSELFKANATDIVKSGRMHFDEYKETVSEGIRITSNITNIHFETEPDANADKDKSIPTLILFDSFDGCVHNDDRSIRMLNYMEYAEIWLDGNYVSSAARRITLETTDQEDGFVPNVFDIDVVRYRDHAKLVISGNGKVHTYIIAMPDAVRFMYLALTGEHCSITKFTSKETDITADENYIPRIAEEVSFINKLTGDLPNVQIEGYRKATSEAVPAADGLRLRFHAMSLPMSSLIWHCPYILLFSSDDGTPSGAHYKEIACIRLDGEDATYNGIAVNDLSVHRDESFDSWDKWKEFNLAGYECEIRLKRRKDRIILSTMNGGISLKNVSTLPEKLLNVYVAITGDQCAVTDIRVLL